MYSQGGAVLRKDLNGVIIDAQNSTVGFIGRAVAPAIPVDSAAGQYPRVQINGGNLLRDALQRTAPGSNVARIRRSFTQDAYNTVMWKLEEQITAEDAAALARFRWNLEQNATLNLMRHGLIRHELQVQAAIQAPSTFGIVTSGTAYTLANIATFDIGLDVDLAKAQISGRGEDISNLTVAMSLNVFLRARASTKLQNRVRGQLASDSTIDLGAQAVADALGVKQVLVGNSFYDTSPSGSSASSLSNIWNDTYIWIGQSMEGNDFFAGGAVRTLHNTEYLPELLNIETYPEDQTESDIVRIKSDHVLKVLNANAGQLLATQYS